MASFVDVAPLRVTVVADVVARMANPSLVGREYWSATVVVEAGAILRFAESVGDDSVLRRVGPSLEAPLSYLLTLVPYDALAGLVGVAARQIHASDLQIEQFRPILAGQRLDLRSRVIDVVRHVGASGPTDIVSVDDEGRDAASGQVLFRARRVFAALLAREAA